MTDTSQAETEPVEFMRQVVALEYRTPVSPLQQRFDERLAQGVVTGRRCPACSRVYVPPKAFCPICSVFTDEEVEVADRGTVTSFTVVVPIQYPGQTETEEYVLASILLDGADSTIGQQRIEGIPHDAVGSGLRVKAEWRPEGERRGTEGGTRLGFGAAIRHWVPSGEPDADASVYGEHVF